MLWLARIILILVATPAVVGTAVAQQPYTEDFSLAIQFGEIPVGDISFHFQREGDRLIVVSRLKIEEKIGQLVLYERTEKRREVWRNGQVISFTNDIVENRKASQVTAVRIGERIAISGPTGTEFAPLESVPTTFWSIRFVDRTSVYDVRTGKVLLAETIQMMPVKQKIRGREVELRQFVVTGDFSRNLYYTTDNRWAGMRFLGSDARVIIYVSE